MRLRVPICWLGALIALAGADPCEDDPCSSYLGATCFPLPDGSDHVCACARGFNVVIDQDGKFAGCDDINECSAEVDGVPLNTCSVGTVCQNTFGSFRCCLPDEVRGGWLCRNIGARFDRCAGLTVPEYEENVGDVAMACIPTVGNGTVISQGVVSKHAECLTRCKEEGCGSFYLHWTNKTCITHVDSRPKWFLTIDEDVPEWRFLMLS